MESTSPVSHNNAGIMTHEARPQEGAAADTHDAHTTLRCTIAHVRLEREQPKHRRIPKRFRRYVPSPLVQCWNQDSVPTPPASEHNSACPSPNGDKPSLALADNTPPGVQLDQSKVFLGYAPVVGADNSSVIGGGLRNEGDIQGTDRGGEVIPRRSVGELTMRPEVDYATVFHELSLLEWEQRQFQHQQYRHHHHHIQQPVPRHTQQRSMVLQPPIGTGRPSRTQPQNETTHCQQQGNTFSTDAAEAAAEITRPLGPVPSLRHPSNGWPQCPTSAPSLQQGQWQPQFGQEQVYRLPPWHEGMASDGINTEFVGFGAGLGLTGIPNTQHGSVIQSADGEEEEEF
ncbi:hypothetical protein PCL_01445 [Purpureocillium lilacinum]|uniref:Uncharacterized protein n=2 Tax=Purpureocillium lilacinum TaxID=33203 RepID=A0A2U3E3I7_PURLI|nr:hypothetical protein PCL_01445 [Purpureocillium lilacinum]